jgi:large subunit ribosomal protein L37Ae
MAKTKLVGAAGRYGPRYGQHIKRKIADIESKQRVKQKCPFCNKTVKRVAAGIWQCKKCKKRFAGHAYFLDGSLKVKKPSKKEQQEIKEKAEKTKEKQTTKKTTKTQEKSLKKPIKSKKTTATKKAATKKSKNKK